MRRKFDSPKQVKSCEDGGSVHAVTLKDTSEEGLTVLSKTILQKELVKQYKSCEDGGSVHAVSAATR